MHLQQLKGMQSSKQGMYNGVPFVNRRYTKAVHCTFFVKGNGFYLASRSGASPYKHLLSTIPRVLDPCHSLQYRSSLGAGENGLLLKTELEYS